jgi:hypothetical protein
VVRPILIAWALATAALGGLLMAPHQPLPLPEPADPRLAHTLALEAMPGQWFALHALYTECRCSRRVAAHLLNSVRPENTRETVLLVGRPDPALADALAHRFEVRELTQEGLVRLGLSAAPTLVVGGPAGDLRYLGGYTWTKQATGFLDLDVIHRSRQGPVPPAPLFGCAVSEDLAAAVDPLGFKTFVGSAP